MVQQATLTTAAATVATAATADNGHWLATVSTGR